MTPTFSRILEMSQKDKERVVANEEKIKSKQKTHRVQDLDEFPFQSFQEVWDAKKANRIYFLIKYDPELLDLFGTSVEIWAQRILLFIPLTIAVGLTIAGLIYSHHILFLALPIAILGFLFSLPIFQKLSWMVLALTFFLSVYFWFRNPIWALVISCFCISLFLFVESKAFYFRVAGKIALASEPIFCFLCLNEILIVVEKETQKLFHPKPRL